MHQAARIARRGTLTYRDLWRTPEDGNVYEIIDGEVYVDPPPNLGHQDVVLNLAAILRAHVVRHRLGKVWIAPVGVVLERPSSVQPDIIFVAKARLGLARDKAVFGAPDLVVEVLSPSTAGRDRGMKKDLYSRAAVRHYWLVDPRKRTLLALQLEGAAYHVEAALGPRATFKPSLFPGLVLRLRDVFAA